MRKQVIEHVRRAAGLQEAPLGEPNWDRLAKFLDQIPSMVSRELALSGAVKSIAKAGSKLTPGSELHRKGARQDVYTTLAAFVDMATNIAKLMDDPALAKMLNAAAVKARQAMRLEGWGPSPEVMRRRCPPGEERSPQSGRCVKKTRGPMVRPKGL